MKARSEKLSDEGKVTPLVRAGRDRAVSKGTTISKV